ncbi:MAG: sulfatase-like hydrolase/transferase, partial [bacterium]
RRAGLYMREHRRGPFFLWVHYWDPHSPYFPPRKYRDKFAPGVNSLGEAPAWLKNKNALSEEEISDYRSLYEGEIFYTDHEMQKLFGFAGRLFGSSSSLTWVFVGDHGELLGELQDRYPYGFGHSEFIYEENLRVPWIMYGKGVPAGRNVEARVSTVDLAPTLLDLTGFSDLREKDGESLVPLISGNQAGKPETVFFERWLPEGGPLPQCKEPLHGVIKGNMKWIGNRSGYEELYDLSKDPDEKNDLAQKKPEAARKMRRAFERWDKNNPETSPDADQKLPVSVQDFRALGYFK